MQALQDAAITMPVEQAKEKVEEYVASVRARHSAEDAAILRGYKALAKGHTVIDLPKCIRFGGVFDNGLPRLAAATSSHEFVWVHRDANGAGMFMPMPRWDLHHNRRAGVYRFPVGTLPEMNRQSVHTGFWSDHPWEGRHRAMVPIVPPALRPKTSLHGYTTLFEVDEWRLDPKAPVDPALLKHIGGDLYAVLATWNLTDLERTVLDGMRAGR